MLHDRDSPEFTRTSLLRGTMYSRNLDLCLSSKKDVVIPGEFRNLQVNLESEGCFRTIFCPARACFCSRRQGILHFWMRTIRHELSVALFLSVNIHQGNERFSVYSRGKQCAFMSLSELFTERNIPPKLVAENNI